jgi:hypothetical protein
LIGLIKLPSNILLEIILFDINEFIIALFLIINSSLLVILEEVLVLIKFIKSTLPLIVKLDHVLKAYSNLVLLASDVRETVLSENKRPRIF